ncbi:probable D-lactate dehydrogenase, mitochondrial [Watersipora subatra]|uniref:probable D-lactate dehydrogenase, mitochondrial n=1 Tax=Watersipora subatra TaxID=2589382 RepID=UPI00355B4ADE
MFQISQRASLFAFSGSFITRNTVKNSTLVQRLTECIGADKVASSDAVREQHAKDESYHEPQPPDVVVFPSCVQEVSALARACTELRVPMIPFGTGTGMEGGVVSTHKGVCVDLGKMDEVTGYNPEDFTVSVQPGVTRLALNEYAKGDGLWFPVDPGADASLCGMAATSASGTNAVRYGTMRENVLNLEVVLADGTVIHTAGEGRRTRKTAAGYNLTNLFVGSEGTLGFITGATLRLYGIPESMTSAVCQFDTINAAVMAVQEVLQSGVPIARIELLDDIMIMAANKYNGLSYDEKPSLFLEFHGSESHTEEQTKVVAEIFNDAGCSGFQWASDLQERNRLWKARHTCLYAAMALRPGTRQLSTDVCVPISQLADVIVETKQDIIDHGVVAPVVGHVGDGNFHVTLLYDPADPKEKELSFKLADRMVRRAQRVNGTCTGEHGVGIGKKKYLEEELGQGSLKVMGAIKQALDPYGLMNPGKVIPT